MKLSRFCFVVSTLSTFGALWAMLMRIVPSDLLSWFVVIFSFGLMGLSAIYVTSPHKVGDHG